jgi:tRNA/tmRNA/rRNA uracil-C5-methylase (TrmA/RlmC/RlmD family)
MRKPRTPAGQPHAEGPLGGEAINGIEVDGFGLFQRPLAEGVELDVTVTSTGQQTVVLREEREQHLLAGTMTVREEVGDYRFAVRADGFWQVHPGAAGTLTEAVLAGLDPRAGEHILDLFSGAGLFTLPIADRVGLAGRVDAMEGDRRAVADARRNIGDRAWVHVHEGDVAAQLRKSGLKRCDGVVLDPPRTGAGREVVTAICALAPARIVYVACDPAAFARDVRYLADLGYRLAGARAFDLFPMTHHLETVGTFIRA